MAAIRYGHFHRAVRRFALHNHKQLNGMLSAFFGVCLIARKLNRYLPHQNVYLKKFLRHTQWRPTLCEAVAGALRYPRYTWWDRLLIRGIMWMTGGETDPHKEVVYTNWQQVERLSDTFIDYIKQRSL